MKYLFIILTTLFLLGFVAFATFTAIVRKKAKEKHQRKLLNETINVPIAHAGSEEGCSPLRYETVAGLKMLEFKDKSGNIMNPDDYNLFIVEGECMRFVNIHDKNLVFATKGFNYKSFDGEMPIVLVLKKTTASPGSPQFKLRRSWRFCKYSPKKDEMIKIIREIMKSSDFQEIRKRDSYDSDEEMETVFIEKLKQFEEKYIKGNSSDDKYKNIVISTTFHANEQKTFFSIHPVVNIVGKVKGAFKLPEECIVNQ